MVRGKELVTKDFFKSNNNKGDNWSENFLKNSVEKPFGPGDLPLCMALIADTISLTENSLSSSVQFDPLNMPLATPKQYIRHPWGLIDVKKHFNFSKLIF